MNFFPHEIHIGIDYNIERPYTGHYINFREVGEYRCLFCDLKLFMSDM